MSGTENGRTGYLLSRKYTTLSTRRFTSLTVTSSDVDMTLLGVAGEEVEVTAAKLQP